MINKNKVIKKPSNDLIGAVPKVGVDKIKWLLIVETQK